MFTKSSQMIWPKEKKMVLRKILIKTNETSSVYFTHYQTNNKHLHFRKSIATFHGFQIIS